jgi:hypothetical protein
MQSLKSIIGVLVFVAWLGAVATGFSILIVYANTPGESLPVNSVWPMKSKLARTEKTWALVLFVHPKCSCSVASLGELTRLQTHFINKVKTYVVFSKSKDRSTEWAHDKLWLMAETIPGVEIFLDEDGSEADLFTASTSGQTFLYNLKGELLFHGGITPARGHMGDSVGRDAILELVESGFSKISSTRSFGCALKSRNDLTLTRHL